MLVNLSRILSFSRTAWQALLLLFAFSFAHPALAEDDYLEPQVAFKFSASVQDAKTVVVNFKIAPGYYMYRERLKFVATGAKLGQAQLPQGKVKYDQTFEKEVETYRDHLQIVLPVEGSGPFTLNVTSQGCADAGLCYPPMESVAKLALPTANKAAAPANATAPGGTGPGQAAATPSQPLISSPPPATAKLDSTPLASSAAAGVSVAPASGAQVLVVPTPTLEPRPLPTPVAAAPVTPPAASATVSEQGQFESALKGGKLLVILPLFFLLGLGLSLTPCVLPMVPILSFIIVGEGAQVSRARGLVLSLAYVLGMSIIYTLLGVVSALAGEGLNAALQNPWVLGAFGLLLAGLSLAMFDVYQLQMPAFIQNRLIASSEKQSRGKLFGVFVMGALSALIVGPCVTAPLVGVLVYISQTRDAMLGGSALFAMALGMGTPLILMGVSAGALLPKAGLWMDAVKKFFGVLLLGVALWMVSPVLPAALQMLGWMALCIGYGMYLLRNTNAGWMAKAVGLVFAILGSMQLIGVASGGRDPLAPLAHLSGKGAHQEVHFQRIKTSADLDRVLAANAGKVVMLDFYADWCVSCKEMEKLTFPNPQVAQKMGQMVLLQVDVTANDAADKEMLKRFKLFGPPGIIFFDKQGQEMVAQRVVGFQNAEKFAASLQAVLTLVK